MPPVVAHRGGRLRRILLVVLLLFVGASGYAFVGIGRFLTREDPLQKADAIFVLAGSRVERPLEAADLYAAGYAPRIVISRGLVEPGVAIAERRGAHIPRDEDVIRDMLMSIGVPATALVLPDRPHDNTADEARTLREFVKRLAWHRVIVVTSKYHLRRAALACRRELRGSDVQLIMRGSRYDPSTPEQWWRRRSDIRVLMSEVPKLIGYALGTGA